MKKLFLLSLIFIISCSKDSEDQNSPNTQTLIEELDGQFLGDYQAKIAIEKSQTHPITHITTWYNQNQDAECYRNYYYDNYSNFYEGAKINSFEILTNNVSTFISELKYTNYCESCTSLDGIPAENTVTVELSISETGSSYIFKTTHITEWPGSTSKTTMNLTNTGFYNLIDIPQTVIEACDFFKWN